MSDELIAIFVCCILGLIAQGASRFAWLNWLLRVVYAGALILELFYLNTVSNHISEFNGYTIWYGCAFATFCLFIQPLRKGFSWLFTVIDYLVSGRCLIEIVSKKPKTSESLNSKKPLIINNSEQSTSSIQVASNVEKDTVNLTRDVVSDDSHSKAASDISVSNTSNTIAKADISGNTFITRALAEHVFNPDSIPHINGLWIYITTLAFLLTQTHLEGLQLPMIPIPIPATFDQLFSYNFLGLVMLAICGAGILVNRNPMQVLQRLGLVKPSWKQVGIGVLGIFFTFFYDYLWSTYTHSQEGMGYANKLSHYNEGTFVGGGSPGPALFIASATGLCAGLGEETLVRGGLQPVFGILPAAFMHAVLHGQFAHAPLLILQVFGWSAMMGILRRYTNTTTTIITHVGFNFVSTFLFAFNP